MVPLYAVTMFISAALLFMVQPMIGRLVLPLVGGSPAAWNTCMVFFQSLLLLGYAYAHWITTRFNQRKQLLIHSGVFALALISMAVSWKVGPSETPFAVFSNLAPQGSSYPMFGMLQLLAVAIGLPFFVVSTSAPLLQRWFSVTGHRLAGDPYFLYAASNLGSLMSLLGYPIFIEPKATLFSQQWIWGLGFVIFAGLAMICGMFARYAMPVVKEAASKPEVDEPIPPIRKIKWIALAFVPSSLMLGVTTHMTTDITSMPLLWVPPLALYLITFIIAFARIPKWFRVVIGNIAPVALLLLVFVMCAPYETGSTGHDKMFFWLALHIGVYFLVALMCHTELAFDRPSANQLTYYFLWMSFGGMLGGIFNALIAPIIFQNTWEYPAALAVAAFLVPKFLNTDSKTTQKTKAKNPVEKPINILTIIMDFAFPLIILVMVANLSLAVKWPSWQPYLTSISDFVTQKLAWLNFKGSIKYNTIGAFIAYAIPCMLAFFCIDRPIRFGFCVFAILAVGIFRQTNDTSLDKKRSYFGILRTSDYEDTNTRYGYYYKKALFAENDPLLESFNTVEKSEIIKQLRKLEKDNELQKLTDEQKNEMFKNLDNELTKKLNEKIGIAQTNFIHLDKEHYLQLVHGTTLHGKQAGKSWRYSIRDEITHMGLLSPWNSILAAGSQLSFDLRQEPMTYYHRTGPVGHAFQEAYSRFDKPHVAMIGLGSGSVACYAQPNLPFTFFEIDPAVLEIVDKPKPADKEQASKQFTYLADARARGAKIEVIMGDGRLKLAEQKDRKYHLLLVDAFSSDSIPLHLLTKEAVALYMNRLDEHGLLMLHISNKFVNLEPVCDAIAKELKLEARIWSDSVGDSMPEHPGKTSSHWVVMARRQQDLGNLGLSYIEAANVHKGEAASSQALLGGLGWSNFYVVWQPLNDQSVPSLWTDDYADVMRVMIIPQIKKLRRALSLPHLPIVDEE